MARFWEWFGFIFESTIFIYGMGLLLIYALLALLSFKAITKYLKKRKYTNYETLVSSPIAPGISILAPAFNEGLSIIVNVQSLMTLNYPDFEVILINDGSTDDTLEKLVKEFELVPIDFAYNAKVVSKPIKQIYKSKNPAFKKLTVIDKINGKSKADAVNAGINIATHQYFVCTDVDCILVKDTLLKLIKPVLEEKELRVIATGATLRIANSCVIDQGVVVKMEVPKNWLARFQELEYIRSFVLGKMGWSQINCVPNVSGGLGLFDKEIAIKSGGYDAQSFGEDMELVFRMCRYACDNNIAYAVRYVPETLCFTEAPESIKVFMAQRTRWARGLAQLMYAHFKMFLNPKYGRAGMIVFPYNFFFELLAPIIEIAGLIFYVYLIIKGQINTEFALILLLFAYLYAVMITTISVLLDQITFRNYSSWQSVIKLCLTALFEALFYHPMIIIFSLRGFFFFLTGKKHSWGNMQRRGLGQNA